ncbi:MAG: coenzyme biosynthesis protein PqqD [Proteobacteria bacterium]|nr:coenzyme biosynthesis protein PqqD [Pseudomonadota bacterium]
MLSQHVLLSPEALFQEIGGEGVILDLKSSSYFGLDEVGVRLWQLLQADPSLQAACDTLLAEYDVEPAQLEDDLIKLLDQLAEAGLVTVE